MNKLIPLMLVVAMSVPAANANMLTDAAKKAVSMTKTVARIVVVNPLKKVVSVTRSLVNGGLGLVGNVTDTGFNAAEGLVGGAEGLVK